MVMPRRYKDFVSKKKRRPAWVAWLSAAILLVVTIVAIHGLVTALEAGRKDWWLGVLALLITLATALCLAASRRQSDAR
jgi:uncharacterized membrane protein YhaH (DUF805 family)